MNMKPLMIDVHKKNFGSIIRIDGEIGSDNYEKFMNAAVNEVKNNNVLIDFTDVKYIASVAIGTLVKVRNEGERNGKKLILFALAPSVQKVIKVSRMEKFFIITGNEKDAVKLING
ncbi:STAS domain-containing protein [Spirochaetota bacterium]